MTKIRNAQGSASLALLIAGATLMLAACGGGSSPAPAPTTPGPGPNNSGQGGAGVFSPVVSPSPTTPTPNPVSGLVGTCPSLIGGSAAAAGYEIGFCNTYYNSGNSVISEATFQNQGVTTPETPAANQYSLNLPNTTTNPWGGTIALALGGNFIKVAPQTIGNIVGGYGIDRFNTTVAAPAADDTSLVDFSSNLGTPRYASFGLWGRSKLSFEAFYGGFFGPAFGQSATPASFLSTATSTINIAGPAASWYIYNATTPLATGQLPRLGLSATTQLQVNLSSGVITGTISDFFDRSSGAPKNLGLASATFTANLVKSTGAFSGTVTGGGNTGIIKGSLYGPNAEQAAGQFAFTSTGNRILTGAFGGKQ
jgi:hypothetical protein